jgi:drug/metabolite transporter (DMT)-like permease
MHAAVPPVALAFCRWTGALLVVIGFAWPHVRRDLPTLRASWRELLLLAALGVSAFNTLVYFGLHSTTVINGVLLQSAMPLLIIVGAYVIYRERTGAAQLLAIFVSLAGVAVIVARGSLRTLQTLTVAPGDGLIFLAVVCYAFYSVLLRKRPRVHPLSFLAATFAMGAALLLPLYLWEHFVVQQLRLTPATLATIGYVSVFPSLLSYLFFNRSVELIGASRVGQFLHLMPVFGSILAAAFLGERLHGYHLVGIILIAAGIALASAVAKSVSKN